MLGKLIKISGPSEEERDKKLYRDLLKHEAKIGGELFGPIPTGGRREFFCLDQYTWIWYEEWTDKNKNLQTRTTRYDVRSNGIYRVREGQRYQLVSDNEALRLRDAVRSYQKRVMAEIYNPALSAA